MVGLAEAKGSFALQVDTQELQANVVAAYVCNGQAAELQQLKREMGIDGASSEVGFNLACASLQLQSLRDAEQQLQLALRAGTVWSAYFDAQSDRDALHTEPASCCAMVDSCLLAMKRCLRDRRIIIACNALFMAS